MRIQDYIRGWFKRGSNVLISQAYNPYGYGLTALPFGQVIFQNIVDLLTDLCNDVTFVNASPKENIMGFADFKVFFDAHGQVISSRLFNDGFVVVGKKENVPLRMLLKSEYTTMSDEDKSIVVPLDKEVQIYVIKSPTWLQRCMSDRQFLNPYLQYLDNILNASNTSCARLGNLVVASPKNGANAPTQVVLTEEQKDKLEKDIAKDYGALEGQKNLLLLPREMAFQVINLAGLDMKTAEKVRMCVCVIADRIKVPANQSALIDSNSSKSLSNGSELREGDFNKYQSFERFLNQTWVKMANDMGLKVNYTIYNKPVRQAIV